jgi:hypothetical protein
VDVKFTLQEPPEEFTTETWRSACRRFAVVVCPFMFGQFRVQLWHWNFGLDCLPDNPGPHW